MRLGRKVPVVVSFLVATLALAQGNGEVTGTVTGASGAGLSGVSVVINELGAATLTGGGGRFTISGVPAGTYTLSYSLGDHVATEEGVEVTAGQTTRVEKSVGWNVSFAETITVISASRRAERVIDAPAAVTVVTAEEIESQASHGQLPKLLEYTPGAEVTQSGLYDFNLNTRGFNSTLNRRVAVLIDGRDPSVPFLGAQEWAAVSFPLDEIANLEFLRGPSAALYGANASSGVINMVTKRPADSQGGQVRLTGGEVDTLKADFRWAGSLGGDWYVKLMGGAHSSGDFTVSRMGAAEYAVPCDAAAGISTDCLPQESVPLVRQDDDELRFGGLRFDKQFGGGQLLTIEGGTASVKGPAFQTNIGRVQLVDVERPWARVNFSTDHWNLLGYYTKRDAPFQRALGAGNNLNLDTDRTAFEVQTHWDFAGDKARVVAGGTYIDENIDSFDPTVGRQTLLFEPTGSEKEAFFGQLDYQITDRVKLVVAGRFDDSTLHDSQVSPKASLVFGLAPNHTLRLTYNEAFQVANYTEFFLQANVAAPVDLAPFEGFCAPFGVACGFDTPVPILGLGNRDLDIEEIQTIELGYSGILGGKAYLTVDLYSSESSNFITDLIPTISTALGRFNAGFGPYAPPSGLPAPAAQSLLAALQGALGPTFFIMSNNFDGSPIFAAVSYANFGDVDTEGLDVGLNYYLDERWTLSATYSYSDFQIAGDLPGFAQLLVPNSPENKASGGVAYRAPRWDAGISFRWVDDFEWATGPFQGTVPSYTVADVTGNFEVNDRWSVGINVANAFDDVHYESFGGDLLERRALGHVTFRW